MLWKDMAKYLWISELKPIFSEKCDQFSVMSEVKTGVDFIDNKMRKSFRNMWEYRKKYYGIHFTIDRKLV